MNSLLCNFSNRWTYEDPSWARIADLLPVVISSAEAGDEVANNILHNSVAELADSVKAVVRRLGLSGEGAKKKRSNIPLDLKSNSQSPSFFLFFLIFLSQTEKIHSRLSWWGEFLKRTRVGISARK